MKLFNVYDVMQRLISENRRYLPVLSNAITIEINSETVFLKLPDIKFLKEIFYLEKENLNRDVSTIAKLSLTYGFYPFKMPLLPYPVSGSKYRNYLLFLFKDSYVIIKKNIFEEAFDKAKPAMIEKSGKITSLFEVLLTVFKETLPALKEEWRYLHPIFTFTDYENMFSQMETVEKVFLENEKNGIKDIRRFIGNPCFTVIDYKFFFEE